MDKHVCTFNGISLYTVNCFQSIDSIFVKILISKKKKKNISGEPRQRFFKHFHSPEFFVADEFYGSRNDQQ